MNDICKLCSEPLPKLALHFSNKVAIELGYCCFMCMRSDMGDDKAFKRLASNARSRHEAERREEREGNRQRWIRRFRNETTEIGKDF